MPVPHADFHEVWWIYSPINGKEWAGLRIAHFRKTVPIPTFVEIMAGALNEADIVIEELSSEASPPRDG